MNPLVMPQEVVEAIQRAKTIYLSTHLNPDGDAIGSELALSMALRGLGKDVLIVNVDPVPATLRFLPGASFIQGYQEGLPLPDLVIMVECPDVKRMGAVKSLLDRTKGVLNLDHHPTNSRYGTWNVVVEEAAALGEMVYDLIRQLEVVNGGLALFHKDIAACLYAAILTDTGRFGYSNTSSRTHAIAADLLSFGLNPNEFVRKIYETSSHERFTLLAKSLATLHTEPDASIAWMQVTHEMFQETKTTSEDTEGFVNYPRALEGVEVALLFREDAPGTVKVSLRSARDVKVNGMALRFGGGGHEKAAGCLIKGTMEEAQKKVLAVVREMLYKK